MASRILAQNVARIHASGLARQNARAIPTLARTLATAADSKTRTTTLSNGLTIATETIPGSQTATVGVWIDAGSRDENLSNTGAAHFVEHLAFKGTHSRSGADFEKLVGKMGGKLDAYTTREQTAYFAHTLKSSVSSAVEIVADVVQNSTLSEEAIEAERQVLFREQEKADSNPRDVVFDHLHATAFQGNDLGRPVLALKENILQLNRDDLSRFVADNYTANRMVLVGAGAVDHEELVRLAEKNFNALKEAPRATHPTKPSFYGSEIRIRDDLNPAAHIALAVEGAPAYSPDYYTMLVMQAIMGSWDRTLGSAAHLSSRFSHIVNTNKLANSFDSFNLSYKDTGLWGIYLNTESKSTIDDLVYFMQLEWARLSTTISEGEVERAKQQVKASLYMGLDSPAAVAETIGSQVISVGKRIEASEIASVIDQITSKDVRRVANYYLWDKEVAVVGLGSIEGLPDYNRVRGVMSLNRF
ncbi:mitochondrial processing peptidase complex beta subunit Qcr1 [Basidiobolus meristosporus CBS 931.73]|uniref:mitochondrial processing peptidase n=1 Tax=Basidiobolus meristosporus CBS 931.73 TaxID=1314790 RepID=A0A1Y1YK02_9FUNG|nr:mitochondrial processing peptidase complex beta subunit Qcr1 [Basidiobolus meristosporus CBS 931.73]|eukprot:ORX98329.1 mitochondrial processing peptidase complex beta subunit Qcr1 [Basidiobolus meristosporus CBS 931.73]